MKTAPPSPRLAPTATAVSVTLRSPMPRHTASWLGAGVSSPKTSRLPLMPPASRATASNHASRHSRRRRYSGPHTASLARILRRRDSAARALTGPHASISRPSRPGSSCNARGNRRRGDAGRVGGDRSDGGGFALSDLRTGKHRCGQQGRQGFGKLIDSCTQPGDRVQRHRRQGAQIVNPFSEPIQCGLGLTGEVRESIGCALTSRFHALILVGKS